MIFASDTVSRQQLPGRLLDYTRCLLWLHAMGARISYPMVDLSGKVAVVTGGNTGIGYETVRQLAYMGAHVIMASRSEEKAKTAIEHMTVATASGSDGREINVEFMQLDLASLQSTKDFVTAFKERNLPLHILVNNAGIAFVPQSLTGDGFELHFQVNHLSHFLLTLELLPTIVSTASSSGDCRIVFVSSHAQSLVTEWEPDNLNGERWYGRMKFYSKSKFYNVVTAYTLQRHLHNVGITVSSLHPGSVGTDIVANGFRDSRVVTLLGSAVKPFLRSTKDGAATSVNCASNPELNSQQCFYYMDCRVAQSNELSRGAMPAILFKLPGLVHKEDRNQEVQEELWKISIDLLKEYLSPLVLERYGPARPSWLQAEGLESRQETRQPSEVGDSRQQTEQGSEEGGQQSLKEGDEETVQGSEKGGRENQNSSEEGEQELQEINKPQTSD